MRPCHGHTPRKTQAISQPVVHRRPWAPSRCSPRAPQEKACYVVLMATSLAAHRMGKGVWERNELFGASIVSRSRFWEAFGPC